MNNYNRGHEFDTYIESETTIKDMLNNATEVRVKQIQEKQTKDEIINAYKNKVKGGSRS